MRMRAVIHIKCRAKSVYESAQRLLLRHGMCVDEHGGWGRLRPPRKVVTERRRAFCRIAVSELVCASRAIRPPCVPLVATIALPTPPTSPHRPYRAVGTPPGRWRSVRDEPEPARLLAVSEPKLN